MKASLLLALMVFSGSVFAEDFVLGQVKTDTSVASHCDQDRSASASSSSGQVDGNGGVKQ